MVPLIDCNRSHSSQVQYKDYFETREKRKLEYADYFNNSIIVKSRKDMSKAEYPAPA